VSSTLVRRGRVWKTTNAGVSWVPIFDEFTNVDSIGAVQGCPVRSEHCLRGHGRLGWRSLGGRHGTDQATLAKPGRICGLDETTKINRWSSIPKTPNIGHRFLRKADAKHSGAGVYRTTDGGRTWTMVLKPENANGTRDVEYAL
jgi:hypothetical protein